MKIEVFKNFELIDMIDVYRELTTNRLFRGAGEITIKLNTLEYSNSLEIDNVVMVDGEAYFIEGFSKYNNAEKVQTYEASGHHINSILERRTIIVPYTVTTDQSYEYHIQQLILQNIMLPSDTNRRIANFTIKSTSFIGYPVAEYAIEKQSLGEGINTICESAGFGYRIDYDIDNARFVFSLLKGVDRTDEVMFSEDFNNVENSELTRDSSEWVNVCYLNNDGSMAPIGAGTGLDRREFFVEGDKVEDAQKLLDDNKIKDNVNTDILKTEQYEYKTDWNLGDIVTFIDKEIGFVVAKPILAIKEISGQQYAMEVDFGERIPILK